MINKSQQTASVKDIPCPDYAPDYIERHITLNNAICADAEKITDTIHSALGGAVPLFITGFGAAAQYNAVTSFQCPVLWLHGCTDTHPSCAGMYIYSVKGQEVRTKNSTGVMMCTHESPLGMNGIIGHCRKTEAVLSPPAETEKVFTDIKNMLAASGFSFTDIYRTWFYNRDILAWYGSFNKVRTEFYTKEGVFSNILPASTGIGAENPFGRNVMYAAAALKPARGVTIRQIDSPLQGPAVSYGSSFSRATLITQKKFRKVFISGTASIDRTGASVHLGNFKKQTEFTFEVVEKILSSIGMNFSDITRSIAYIRESADFPVFRSLRHAQGLGTVPMIVTRNTVCRDDLLFEYEADAVKLE